MIRKDAYLSRPFVLNTGTIHKHKNASMDFKQIQELIKMINKSNIGELSVEEEDFKLTIRQKEEKVVTVTSAPVQQSPVQVMAQPSIPMQPAQSQAYPARPETVQKADNLVSIKSPMIGTFYRRPSPDKPIFVEVGDDVTPGKVVCIIEAMKLFNEIESEISGRIVKILVDDASPVEYDQPLFLVEPA